MQMEASECGLACLAMIAGHHGAHLTLKDLRDRFSVGSSGTSVMQLVTYGECINLKCRAVRASLDEISELSTPCLLHFSTNHFVVLTSANARAISIIDPAHGSRTLSTKDASSLFTGVAIEASPTDLFSATPRARSRRSYVRSLMQYARPLMIVAILSMVVEITALFAPQSLQILIDQIISTSDISLLAVVSAGFVLLTAFNITTSSLRSWALAHIGAHATITWTDTLFRKLMQVDMRFFERRSVGDIISKSTAIHSLHQSLTGDAVAFLLDGLFGLATIFILFAYSKALTLLIFSGVMLYVLIRSLSHQHLQGITGKAVIADAAVHSDLIESIQGITSIRLNSLSGYRISRHFGLVSDLAAIELRSARGQILLSASSHLLAGALKIVVFYLGAKLIVQGEMTIGMLMAFTAYADQFTGRSIAMIDFLARLALLRVHIARAEDILESDDEKGLHRDFQGPRPPPDLAVTNLYYRYAPEEEWVLRDANLHVKPGECVAISGSSGCGKSTLLKVILGLAEPTSGTVLIGGQDINLIGKPWLRDQLGVVLQDDRLFTGTILENLCLGRDDLPMDAIYAATSAAEVHNDIVRLPQGYQTLIGEAAFRPSGGQIQRIILARALCRSPKILIMDEATSNLDSHCEERVAANLRSLGITRLIVAHRETTIASADRVLHMSNGGLSECEPPI